MIVNESNWMGVWATDFQPYQYIFMKIEKELFQTDDRGVNLMEKISNTHTQQYIDGDGITNGYVLLYKSKLA